jgi:hypothetical protein
MYELHAIGNPNAVSPDNDNIVTPAKETRLYTPVRLYHNKSSRTCFFGSINLMVWKKLKNALIKIKEVLINPANYILNIFSS